MKFRGVQIFFLASSLLLQTCEARVPNRWARQDSTAAPVVESTVAAPVASTIAPAVDSTAAPTVAPTADPSAAPSPDSTAASPVASSVAPSEAPSGATDSSTFWTTFPTNAPESSTGPTTTSSPYADDDCGCHLEGCEDHSCDPITGQCRCKCGINGLKCDQCMDFHYNFPSCEDNYCACSEEGSISQICDKQGGQCSCKPNVVGRTCDKCDFEFKHYPNCEPCDCNVEGSFSQVCVDSGQCPCLEHIEGIQCDHCKDTYYGFPSCQPCLCDALGSDGLDCNVHGICTCKKNVAGDKCDKCSTGYKGHPTCHECDDTYFGYPDCKECGCHPEGASTPNCDIAGKCACNLNVEGEKCDRCAPGFFGFPDCVPCECNMEGSDGIECNSDGQCKCQPNVIGLKCDEAADEYHHFPAVRACGCNELGMENNICNKKTGHCDCLANVAGQTCDECKPQHYSFPSCLACNCNLDGRKNDNCNHVTGDCDCKENIVGSKCSKCADQFFGFPTCEACECDTLGTVDGTTCSETGKCVCKEGYAGDKCDQCAATFFQTTIGGETTPCTACGCETRGSVDGNCDDTGKCKCNDELIEGDKCDACIATFFGFPDCEECDCNMKGVENGDPTCDKDGQCNCKCDVTGKKCDVCEIGHQGWPDCHEIPGFFKSKKSEPKCPIGWTDSNGKCYKVGSGKKTWSAAKSDCVKMDGNLGEPKSKDENTGMANLIIAEYHSTQPFWIGLSDSEVESKYVYGSDGTAPTYVNWNWGEPSTGWGGRYEDCVEVLTKKSNKWNDVPCDRKYPYVCEIEKSAERGEWSPWSDWSSCAGTECQTGTRTRTRTCIGPHSCEGGNTDTDDTCTVPISGVPCGSCNTDCVNYPVRGYHPKSGVASAAACQALCATVPECVHFTYAIDWSTSNFQAENGYSFSAGDCWLKTSNASCGGVVAGLVSAPKTC